MERLSLAGTLKRARTLLARVWPTAMVIAILQFAFPLLVWIASIDSRVHPSVRRQLAAPRDRAAVRHVGGIDALPAAERRRHAADGDHDRAALPEGPSRRRREDRDGMTLGRAFIEAAKRRPAAFCMADSTGQELTFARALTAALLLSGEIRRLAPNERYVGLLLPASVGGALANVATSLAGKVPVNLNFTAGHDAMAAAVERCGITTILTARDLRRESRHRDDGRDGLRRGLSESDPAPDQAAHGAGRQGDAGPVAGAPLRARDRAGRGRDHHLLERQHGCSQGRDAHPPEHPVEHRRLHAGVQADRSGRDDRGAAVLSRVRFHRDAVAAIHQRVRRRLPPEPDGREDDWGDRREVPRHDHHQHADVLFDVHPQGAARAVREPALRCGRSRKAARADRHGIPGTLRDRPHRGLWLHRDVAGRGSQHARTAVPARSAGRFQASARRSSIR